jgi:hypothetical protein
MCLQCVTGLAGNRDPTATVGVLELTVATTCRVQAPPLMFNQLDDLTDLQRHVSPAGGRLSAEFHSAHLLARYGRPPTKPLTLRRGGGRAGLPVQLDPLARARRWE